MGGHPCTKTSSQMFSFGNNSSNPSNAQTSTSNNFGGFNLNQQSSGQSIQQPPTFGFGSPGASSSTAPVTNNSGMFGSFNQQPSASVLNINQQPLSSLSQQTSTGIMYPRDTNFLDLPADLRKAMEDLDKTIQSHADAYRPFSNRVDPTDKLEMIENKLSLLEEKISAFSSFNAQQTSRISSLKKATSGHWRYSENAARTIEASRNPADASNGGKITWTRAFAPNDSTASHFEEILKEMDTQMCESEEMAEALRKQIEPFVSNISTGQSAVASPTEAVKFLLKTELEISAALQRRYIQIRDEIELMRRNYKAFSAKYRRDSRDPFSPKVVETEEKEREREKKKDFFGLNQVVFNQNNLNAMLPSATTNNLFPSSTTSLPTKSSLSAFSFGRN